MVEFRLVDVGEGLHEAEILRWLVQVGDTVKLDEPLVEIQTDKAAVELPSPVAGRISKLNATVGQMVHVGDVLVLIESNLSTPAPAATAVLSSPTPGDNGSATAAHTVAPASGIAAGPGSRVLAAPAVRRMALELGVDLRAVRGTGPAGRILPQDLQAYVASTSGGSAHSTGAPAAAEAAAAAVPVLPSASPAAHQAKTTDREQQIPLVGLRRRISERMTEAWQIPHVTAFEDLDAFGLVALREKLVPDAQARGIKLTFMPWIIKATIAALKKFPALNATLDFEQRTISLKGYYHIGVATATEQGLLVPVVRNVDQMSLLDLANEIARLTEGAQKRTLSQSELVGSTFTITNFGSYGGTRGTPIINPPEVAILGIGTIAKRPWVVNDEVVARPVLPISLSFDHRVIDGYDAGRFLSQLIAYLTRPELLLLEMI